MADDDDPEIAAALAKLVEEDAAAGGHAAAALRWIAGDQGPAGLTQQRVQSFCWYQLPMKWQIDRDGMLRIAAALGKVLDLLQLPRYAAICRSDTTRDILGAYDASSKLGKAAFRRAAAASGIDPPNLPEFEWGAVMGLQESEAWSSVADFLEVAVASGDLVPGGRGWKIHQQNLERAHLNAPQLRLLGQTYAHTILTERAETWVGLRHSETRRKPLAALANQLLHPARLPAGTDDPLPRLRWLLDELAGGIPLTDTGNLNRKFVQQAADRLGWDFDRPPQGEDGLYDLRQLRHLAQRLGLARRAGRTLGLTAKGRRLLDEPDELWRTVAAALLACKDDFIVYVGELFLALLVRTGSLSRDEITATIWRATCEEGFRDSRLELPPTEDDVSWVMHDTINMCRALGLLAVGADVCDRAYGFTEVGKAVGLEALRARATGPRTIPWSSAG